MCVVRPVKETPSYDFLCIRLKVIGNSAEVRLLVALEIMHEVSQYPSHLYIGKNTGKSIQWRTKR